LLEVSSRELTGKTIVRMVSMQVIRFEYRQKRFPKTLLRKASSETSGMQSLPENGGEYVHNLHAKQLCGIILLRYKVLFDEFGFSTPYSSSIRRVLPQLLIPIFGIAPI
jgi:hypothetical protein